MVITDLVRVRCDLQYELETDYKDYTTLIVAVGAMMGTHRAFATQITYNIIPTSTSPSKSLSLSTLSILETGKPRLILNFSKY